MPDEIVAITKEPAAHPSMDFTALREEGLRYIGELAGKVWTDYNLHDPGITALEALIFAITDLGYRTQFEMRDLLTSQDENPLPNFHTLAEVSTNCPWTPDDYRKLLRDQDQVRSGWLRIADSSETGQDLNGLYNAYLELEEDVKLGNLNDNSVTTTLTVDPGSAHTHVPDVVTLDVEFPPWEVAIPGFENVDPNSYSMDIPDANYLLVPDDPFLLFADLELNGNVTIPIKVRTLSPVDEILDTAQYNTLLQLHLKTHTAMVDAFLEKRALVQSILDQVKQTLHLNRNLCEDFVDFFPMSLQEIGLKVDLRVSPGSDLEEVLAQVWHVTGKFLSPEVPFRSLSELLNAGMGTDQIFQGPLLNNGFITDEDLALETRSDTIFISDLIQLIMDVEGVLEVRGIGICLFIYGELVTEIQVNNEEELLVGEADERDDYCLNLATRDRFAPQLSAGRSSATFLIEGQLPQTANQGEAENRWKELKALDRIRAVDRENRDLPVPEGDWKNLSDYYPVQEDLPTTYGIGSKGLTPTESEQRKAQARQFKGYIHFFEELLAGYLAQLSQLRSLFSWEDVPTVDRTYYSQAVYQAPDVQTLLAGFTGYAEANGLNPDDPVSFDTYLADNNLPAQFDHHVLVGNLLEDSALFEDRRNRFLDHLLARFTENFTDYALWLTRTQGTAAPAQLITAKSRFLTHYPETSKSRGKSFNYLQKDDQGQPDFWDTNNVAGLKKRVSHLLGLADYSRRDFSTFHSFETYVDGAGLFRFRLRNDNGDIILSSAGGYLTQELLFAEMNKVAEHGKVAADYQSLTAQNGTYYFNLTDGEAIPDVIATRLEFFTTTAERDAALQEVIDLLVEKDDQFGFHLVENIILRPRESGDVDLLPPETCSEIDCLDPGDNYSFQLNVVLPAWTTLSTDAGFRRLLDKTLRLETPAHILLRFFWVSREQLYDFEVWYKDRLDDLNGGVEQQVITENLSLWLDQNYRPVSDPNFRMTDISSYSNNAQLYSGKAISTFSGNKYVEGRDVVGINGGNAFTIACWVQVKAFSGTQRMFMHLPAETDYTSGTEGTGFLTDNNERVSFRLWSGAADPYGEHEVPVDTWVRLVGTYDGSDKRFYINGELVEETPFPGGVMHESNALFIGAAHSHNISTHNTDAWFSDVQVWRAVWEEEDVAYDFVNPELLPVLREGTSLVEGLLITHWMGMEGNGSRAYDSSGFGRHGNLVSAGWVIEKPTIPQTALMNYSLKTWFDGTTDGLTIDDDGGANNVFNNGSINWFFLKNGSPAGAASYHNIYCRFDGSTQGVQVYVDDATNRVGVYTSGSVNLFNYVVDDQPHWYEVRFSTNTAELFVDGTDEGSVSLTPVNVTTPTTHKIGNFGSAGRAHGLVDDVRVTVDGEVTGWWKNNPVDGHWKDVSGNGNHANIDDAPMERILLPEIESTGIDPHNLPVNRMRDREILNLDGYSHLRISSPTGMNLVNDFTVECWFNPSDYDSFGTLFFSRGTAAGNRLALFRGSGRTLWAGNDQLVVSELSNTPVPFHEWNHLVATYEGATKRWTYYLNGVEDGTYIDPQAANSLSGDIYISKWSYTTNGWLEGQLGDLRVYMDKALTVEEVNNNFLAQSDKFGL